MDTVLVVGVETVAGANCAAVFGERFRVVGLSQSGVQIEGCEIRKCASHEPAAVRRIVQDEQPAWIVFCGAAARSSWDIEPSTGIDDQVAVAWAAIAHASGAEFTFLSSDAVFTGPWISHDEENDNFCATAEATRIRHIEQSILESHPDALIVRTNVFGWSPSSTATGFAETVLASLEGQAAITIDYLRHSSPMLATDLAAVLLKAFDEKVNGLLHVAGAERTNPFDFAERLAEAAELAQPAQPSRITLAQPTAGFGRGETMLDCSLARELLGVRMPLIDESIRGLLEQRSNGHRDKLRGSRAGLKKAA